MFTFFAVEAELSKIDREGITQPSWLPEPTTPAYVPSICQPGMI